MPHQLGLPAALHRFGLKVELVPGWETRGSSAFNPRGALSHWTAGPKNAKGRPSLNICVNGRAGLPGPLANVYLDRNGVAVIIASGTANHGGVGTWRGQSGNSKFFGTEAESGGDGDWTPAQRDAYPRVNSAYCWLGGFGPDMLCGHHEYATPAGRKIDIRDWPMSLMRSQVAALLASPTEEDIMASINDLRVAIREEVGAAVWRNYPITGRDVNGNLGKGTTAPEMLLASIPRDVLGAAIPNAARRAAGDKNATTTVALQTEWADAHVNQVLARVDALEAKLDALIAAVAGARDAI